MPILPTVPPTTPLPPQDPDVPWPTAEWPTAPDASPSELAALIAEAFPDGGNLDETGPMGQSLAFIAIAGGRLVAEAYGPTASVDEPLISWSMAKSITQACIGLLVGDGQLAVSDPAPIDGWASDPAKSRITVDDLLHMTSGLRFAEDYVDDTTSDCLEMLFGAGSTDMAAYAAAQPMDADPNTVFNYSSGTTNLLCKILADAVGSGPAFEAWMNDRLLGPLGIDARLTFDDVGTWVGSSYLHTTAREFAKFGLLYLRDGVWEDKQLLPDGWVDHARTIWAENDEGDAYGGQWWIWGPDRRAFYAAGYETQRILIDPTRDLVLVRLGKTPTERADAVDEWLERVRVTFPLI